MLQEYRASAMRSHRWIAFAALAIGDLAMSPAAHAGAMAHAAGSLAQREVGKPTVDEAVGHAAELAAPSDGEVAVDEAATQAVAPAEGEAGSAERPALGDTVNRAP